MVIDYGGIIAPLASEPLKMGRYVTSKPKKKNPILVGTPM
jgi:hypothetical protein